MANREMVRGQARHFNAPRSCSPRTTDGFFSLQKKTTGAANSNERAYERVPGRTLSSNGFEERVSARSLERRHEAEEDEDEAEAAGRDAEFAEFAVEGRDAMPPANLRR